MNIQEMLKEFIEKAAVSGNEHIMTEFISDKFKTTCENVKIDKFSNVIGIMNENSTSKTKVMVSAHFDEVGFLVKSIDENGFIKLSSIGGIDAKILLAQEVIIHGKQKVTGIIGAKPPHLLQPEETKKAVRIEDLNVDTGYSNSQLKQIVSIGDIVIFKADSIQLLGNKFAAKSLDNRSGIVAMLKSMELLSKVKAVPKTYFSATTQEEFELAGSIISSYNVDPDVAIVIDTIHGDMPECSKEKCFTLGKGPVIVVGPNLHKNQTKKMIEIAKEQGILYQIAVEAGDTGTEAWATQVSRVGVPTILISIPVRYMHTPIETVSIEDIKNTARLIAEYVSTINTDTGCN